MSRIMFECPFFGAQASGVRLKLSLKNRPIKFSAVSSLTIARGRSLQRGTMESDHTDPEIL